MTFKHYTTEDYQAVCDFLIALNRDDRSHIHWNWARFEWMAEHPEFDRSLTDAIGLWQDGGRVVGAAIYDMYFGEAFCAALPAYRAIYPDILAYAYRELRDDNGLGIAICDTDRTEIAAAKQAGFSPAGQTETIMTFDLSDLLRTAMPEGLRIVELDPAAEPEAFGWLLWQGFDHGSDFAAFKDSEESIPRNRPHFDRRLSLAAQNDRGNKVAYCCLWYMPETDYAYVEPVCTVPDYRGRGVAKALLYEALARARKLGAEKAYVLSDLRFYEKLGFKKTAHYSFWWKEGEET